MSILINHWHCIVPAIAIIAALIVMEIRNRNSSGNGKNKDDDNADRKHK